MFHHVWCFLRLISGLFWPSKPKFDIRGPSWHHKTWRQLSELEIEVPDKPWMNSQEHKLFWYEIRVPQGLWPYSDHANIFVRLSASLPSHHWWIFTRQTMQRAPWLWLATFLAVSLICWISYEGVRTQRHFLLRDVPMAVSTPPSTPSTSSPSSPPSFPLPVLDSIFKPAKAVVSQGKGDTFAVVSRMWRGDLPFLESWLRYYFVQLRVNRVYGILTEQSDLAPLRALSLRAGFGNQLQLWVKDLTNQSIDTSVFDASQIPETFILSIDTDEFVALPVGQSLHSAIAAEPFADIFQLKWRCAPNDTLTEELIPRVGLRCPGYKVMFRTSRFKSFAGPHNINCRRKCKGARKQLVLIHLWYRGVYDALFRQSAGHTQSSFSDRNTGVLEFAESVFFPRQKIQHLGIYRCNPVRMVKYCKSNY